MPKQYISQTKKIINKNDFENFSFLTFGMNNSYCSFLADRTNGRAYYIFFFVHRKWIR